MRRRWKALIALIATATVGAGGASYIYAHGKRVFDDQRTRMLEDIAYAYDQYVDEMERPPLQVLHARLADPRPISGTGYHEAIILIATYGESEESTSVLTKFIAHRLAVTKGRFDFLTADALMVLGFTGGDTATSFLKTIFLRETYDISLRGRAAIGLMVSGPESDAFVREYFFKRRAKFEKKYPYTERDDFLSVLVDSLEYADTLQAMGPSYLVVTHLQPPGCGTGTTSQSRSKYSPREPKTMAERMHAVREFPADFAHAFKTGWNDLWNDLLVGQR